MTPTEAASTLRALGWRCEPPEALVATTPPSETEAAVAPPQAPRVGEVWEATTGRHIKPRVVLRVDPNHGAPLVSYRFADGSGGYEMTLHCWHAWVRRSGARVVG